MTAFLPAPQRLIGELDERIELKQRRLTYHNVFLDDVLRGILPHDLVLIGAPSGVGKTDLALSIATSNANNGVPVHYFALEAEPRELERRTKFALLSALVFKAGGDGADRMNYSDWLLGECEDICAPFNRQVEQHIAKHLRTLFTFYRGSKFDTEDLARGILEVHGDTRLIIVDHLHYIDSDDQDEHRALGDTVKVIRDVSLRVGKPIILIAHLRKRDQRARQLVATLDDFHGSSNITKICTQAIAIEHASSIPPDKWWEAPTFMTVLKDRRAGAPRVVAVVPYDRRCKAYRGHYALGRVNGSEWEPLSADQIPRWARHHHKPREALEGK